VAVEGHRWMCVSKTPEDDIADYWLDVRAVGRGDG
jgi:hypothetical protein